VVCLMGRNGVGKTTLLKSIIGLLRARSGAVQWQGEDVTTSPSYQRARAGIGYVPQGREVFAQLSVLDNLTLGLEARTDGATILPGLVFDLFPMLGQMLHRRGGSLSGGQQQQLAIGRALVGSPRLLLLDEPIEGIQPSIVQEIERAIARLKHDTHTAMLLVEQSLEFALRIADHCCVMERGAIIASGPPAELGEEALRRHLAL